jgi:hypothetical protein
MSRILLMRKHPENPDSDNGGAITVETLHATSLQKQITTKTQ